jgi:hypothetical protein
MDGGPIEHKVLSQSTIYPIEKLFVTAATDGDNAVTPSRFIISNKTLPSPCMYPLTRRTFASDRLIRMTAMNEVGRSVDENYMNMNQDPRNVIDNGHNQHDVGPSEQAKALLERIPDLSYMLSTTLSIPNVK